jgi:hypothetical protein
MVKVFLELCKKNIDLVFCVVSEKESYHFFGLALEALQLSRSFQDGFFILP